MQSLRIATGHLAKKLRITAESNASNSIPAIVHDKPKKELQRLPKEMQQIVTSYLGYRDITNASLICKRGGFFQGRNTIDFIKPLQFVGIPKKSATNEEWISFLFRELDAQGRYLALLYDINQEHRWRKAKVNSKWDAVNEVVSNSSLLLFMGSGPLGYYAGNATIGIIAFFTAVVGFCSSVDSSAWHVHKADYQPPALPVVNNRANVLNNFYNKFCQILAKKGVHFPAFPEGFPSCYNYIDAFLIIRLLFILLNKQDPGPDLEKLNLRNLHTATKQELLNFCIRFCDAKAGTEHLIHRFMRFVDQMQWDIDKDFHFKRSESSPITDIESAILHFPTKTELQKSLLEEFRHFVTHKNRQMRLR